MKYTTDQLLKIIDSNRSNWTSCANRFPVLRSSEKKGKANLFSIDEIYRNAIFKGLVSRGMHRPQANDIVKSIKKISREDYYVARTGDKITDYGELIWAGSINSAMREKCDDIIIINMAKIIDDVDEKVRRYYGNN